MNFGETLRKLRKQYGLSQRELAEELGLGKSTIGSYEMGKREPNFEKLKKIKDFFGVDYNFLLSQDEIYQDIAERMGPGNIELISELRKNKVFINGKRLPPEAKEGLINFLKKYRE